MIDFGGDCSYSTYSIAYLAVGSTSASFFSHRIIKTPTHITELPPIFVAHSRNQLLKDLYYVESGSISKEHAVPDSFVQDYVKIPSMKWVEISSPSAGKPPDTAYLHYVSGDGGPLIVNEIHKDRDENRPGQRFNPSEIAWQSFLLGVEQDGVQASRLRCIIMSHIVNDNTKNVIFETVRVSNSTLSGNHGHKEYIEVDDGFYALLGSVLGKLAMHMLLDHKAEVGYRLVDRVILVGQKHPDPGKARSFLIQLSEPRSRKRAASDYPTLPSTKRRRLSNSIEYIFESRYE